jgi:hypothetical protein
MNTAPQYHSRFLRLALLQSKMRNGMEEVVGSIPTRSTKSLLARAVVTALFPLRRSSGRDCYFIAVKTTLPPTIVITT